MARKSTLRVGKVDRKDAYLSIAGIILALYNKTLRKPLSLSCEFNGINLSLYLTPSSLPKASAFYKAFQGNIQVCGTHALDNGWRNIYLSG